MNSRKGGKIKLMLIGLVLGLLAFAREDTIRFYMVLDTTQSGVRALQEFDLNYICTAEFDSVSPPDFPSDIEVVKGPTPHKVGRAVKNGELADIDEFGFSYRIRFKKAGKNELPASLIVLNGRTYAVSPHSVAVQPAIATLDSVKCRLSTEAPYLKGARTRVILRCNRRPDSRTPLLVINGNPVEPSGHGLSVSNGKEDYSFSYSVVFSDDGYYTATFQNLTFGGMPYQMEETEFAVGNPGKRAGGEAGKNSEGLVIAVALGYMLIVWLLFWLRFHKEADEGLAPFVRKHTYLNLNTERALTHYNFPLLLIGIPIFFVGLNAYEYYLTGKSGFFPLFWCALSGVLAFVCYRKQRAKLYFEPVGTCLQIPALQERLMEVARQHNWTVEYMDDDCFVAHTNPSIWSFTWGELVFVVFDGQQVWINSVNNLDRRSTPFSFGAIRKNIRLIKEAIAEKGKGEAAENS